MRLRRKYHSSTSLRSAQNEQGGLPMEEISFSVFDHGADAIAHLRFLLAEFEQKQHIRVRLTVLPFEGAWNVMVRMALYMDGPDVSAVGTSWVGDFVRMDALHPFTEAEIRALGEAESYLPASWQSAVLSDEQGSTIWAAPWLADARVVCYRRDVLEQAGIDATTAFQSPAHFENALQQLQAAGVTMPLVIPTKPSQLAVHNLASYIWHAGGDFLDARDGALAIDRPEAMAGMRHYFGLGRYLAAEARGCDEPHSDEIFRAGRAAITFSGHWLLQDSRIDPLLLAGLGVAPLLGVPFVGGYHLVVWRFKRKSPAVLKLVEFLAGRQAPQSLYPAFGLPARREILEQAPGLQVPPFPSYAPMLHVGRTFPTARMWGLIEKNLYDALPAIWSDVMASDASDDPDLTAILDRHITSLAHRLRLTLKA
jgi:multiple sugar transport system substrate-binding protein